VDTEVNIFQDDGAWLVVLNGTAYRFEDRQEALRKARDLARLHAPSVILNAPVELAEEPTATHHEAPESPVAAPTDPGRTSDPLSAPVALGRSVLVSAGGAIPIAWQQRERIAVDEAALGDAGFLDKIRALYLSRTPAVFEIPDGLDAPESGALSKDVWSIDVREEFIAEAVWELMTRNAIDLRSGDPSWPLTAAAGRLGAKPAKVGDIGLESGAGAWCDGGPLRLWTAQETEAFGAVMIPREAIAVGRLSPVSAQEAATDLATDQLAAVATREVRARIMAPAGSGKTRVLTERARHLIRAGVPASAMLLVAFNRRAQEEIVERTPDLPGLQVQTLNALGLSILNGTNGFTHAGAGLQTIDEREVRTLLGTMIQFPRRANTDPAASWLDALSEARLGLRSPQSVEASFNGDVDGFAEFFPKYRTELDRRRWVDFDEQIYGAIELLVGDPGVRHQAQTRSQVVLVDEFQDLTPAHLLMLRLLAGPGLAIFGVGDDDQTIYSYSGASPEWLVDFDRYVPMAEHHDLTINYRCPVPVVDAARNLLSRNQFRVAKTIGAGPTNVSDDTALQVIRGPIPVFDTLKLIQEHLANGSEPSDIAVLTRVNTLLAPVQAALRSAGIPVQNRDGSRFLDRTGVAAALAWMRLALTGERLAGADIVRAARRPTRGLSARVIEWMGEQRDTAGLERLAGRISDEKSAAKVLAFAHDLDRMRARSVGAASSEILESIRTETGLDQSMKALDAAHHGRNSAAHSDDLRALVALGHLHPDAATFHSWLGEMLSPEEARNGVTLATVHRVKGLEWPHVIVHDATSGVFPHRLSIDPEEERRVFHVAITRARQSLRIVADESNPSIFLEELRTPGTAPSAEPKRAGTETPDRRGADVNRSQRSAPASIGLQFSWGGYKCAVSTVTDDGVVVSIGSSTMTIPFGSEVMLEGRAAVLAPATKGANERKPRGSNETESAVGSALRAWRLERARRDGVPAYVVFDDKTLEAIVVAMPTTERQLLAVSGMGPKRVELYGNDVLALLTSAQEQG
jgi:DNA helicase-2/ATP-dependent DNA helicase PcrA